MRKKSKFLALLLIVVMAASSVLAGCKNKKEETITLTVYSQLANYSGEQIGWFAKELLDRFNVKVNIVKDDEGVFVTRMESGNLGDIVIFGADTDDYIEAVEKGMLLDWNQDNLLEEFGPYIKENMQKALEKNAQISGGKVYGFGHAVAPSAEDHQAFFYHPDVRWDLYKQLGYPKVETLEDWIDVLAEMKKICPTSDTGKETYGVSLFNDWDGDMVMFVKATGALYGYDEFGVGLYNVENQTWESCLEEGGMYLRSLKFHNQLYQRDLLDPDSLTQKFDGSAEDYQDGAAFFNIFDYMASINYNTPEHIAEGKAMYTLAMEDQKTLTYGLNVYGGNRVWTIGSKTQYPEKCMEIINWLCTPEGRMVSEYGPKGLTWDYDEDGNTYFTDLGLKCREDKNTEMTGDYSGTYSDGSNQMNNVTWALDSYNPDSNGEKYNYKYWRSYNALEASDILQDWRDYVGYTTADEYLQNRPYVVVPGTTYTMATRSAELKLIWEQVITCIKDYSWRAIYAETDEEYEEIVKEMREKAYEYGFEECAQFCIEEAAKRKAAEDEVLGK